MKNHLPLLSEEDLRELGLEDAEALLALVDDALSTVEARSGQGSRDRLPPRVGTVAERHFRTMNGLAKRREGGMAAGDFDRDAQAAIVKAFRQAYALGKGVGEDDLTDGDLEFLRRAAEYEAGFARGFGDAAAADELRMPRTERARLYGLSVEGMAWHGRVEAAGPGARIDWVLGEAEHCEDCLILACMLTDRMRITTSRGDVAFRDVEIGDEVLTHAGVMRRVTDKMVRPSPRRMRVAVLVTQDGLAGFTEGHGLMTSGGWMPAREVAHGDERCLQGLRPADRSQGGQVQGVRREEPREASPAGGSEGGGLQVDPDEAAVGRGLLRRPQEDDRVAAPVGVGVGARAGSGRDGRAPSERRPIGRSPGEPGVEGAAGAQPRPHERPGEPELEGCQEEAILPGVRETVRRVPQPVLQPRVLGEAPIATGDGDAEVRRVRPGVRADQERDPEEGRPARVLLSELLHRMEVAGLAGRDPAVKMLSEEFRAGLVGDQMVEVGQVLLPRGWLPAGAMLHDLAVSRDQSFVAGGMVVHNSNGPYTKESLPTTPRGGDTVCKCITTPWSRVLTWRGWVAIAEVAVGDLVLTHRGRWRRVVATHRNQPDRRHRFAWVRTPLGTVVGCTDDERFLSVDGWADAFSLASRPLPVYAIGHELQAMRRQGEIGCDGKAVRAVPRDLPDLWWEEGRAGGGMCFVRHATEGGVTVGGGILAAQAAWRHREGCRGSENEIRGSYRGLVQLREAGWAAVRLVLGRLAQAVGVPVPLAMGACAWQVGAGAGAPSQERGHVRRSVGEPGGDGGDAAQRHTLYGGREPKVARGPAGAGVRALWEGVPSVRSWARETEAVLQQSLRGAGVILHDLTVDEDESFVVEGLVAHNSRCKCRLRIREGALSAGERQAAAEYADARDASLSDLMNPPAPDGEREQIGRAHV